MLKAVSIVVLAIVIDSSFCQGSLIMRPLAGFFQNGMFVMADWMGRQSRA